MTNSWVLIFFNLLFTSVPPIIYGVLDKDVSGETLLDLPDLYKSGQNSQVDILSHTPFHCVVFQCVVHGYENSDVLCIVMQRLIFRPIFRQHSG